MKQIGRRFSRPDNNAFRSLLIFLLGLWLPAPAVAQARACKGTKQIFQGACRYPDDIARLRRAARVRARHCKGDKRWFNGKCRDPHEIRSIRTTASRRRQEPVRRRLPSRRELIRKMYMELIFGTDLGKMLGKDIVAISTTQFQFRTKDRLHTIKYDDLKKVDFDKMEHEGKQYMVLVFLNSKNEKIDGFFAAWGLSSKNEKRFRSIQKEINDMYAKIVEISSEPTRKKVEKALGRKTYWPTSRKDAVEMMRRNIRYFRKPSFSEVDGTGAVIKGLGRLAYSSIVEVELHPFYQASPSSRLPEDLATSVGITVVSTDHKNQDTALHLVPATRKESAHKICDALMYLAAVANFT